MPSSKKKNPKAANQASRGAGVTSTTSTTSEFPTVNSEVDARPQTLDDAASVEAASHDQSSPSKKNPSKAVGPSPIVTNVNDTWSRHAFIHHPQGARKQAYVKDCAKSNPVGARATFARTSFHDSQGMIAAYVGLQDTGELRAVLKDLDDRPQTKTYWQLYYSGFEVAGKDHNTSWASQELIFKKILAGIIPKARDAIRDGTLPIDKDLFDYKDPHRGHVSVVVFMYFIIKTYPTLFPPEEPGREGSSPSPFLGITTENWFRALWLYKHYYRTVSGVKPSKSQNNSGDSKHSRPVTPIYYMTDEDLAQSAQGGGQDEGMTEERLAILEQFDFNNKYAERFTLDYFQNNKAAATTGSDGDTLVASVEKDNVELDRKLSHLIGRSLPTKSYPHLTAGVRRDSIVNIARTLRLLHPAQLPWKDGREEDGNVVDSRVAAIGSMAGVLDSAGTSAVEELQSSDLIERQKAWDLHRKMNSVTSTTPSYSNCCADLNLDPDKPTSCGRVLEPWQVTGAWWILYMFRSGLGCGILGDDVGLGKTMTALLTLSWGAQLVKQPSPTATHQLGIKGPYKPSMIICTAGAYQVWRNEIAALEDLKLDLRVWVGNREKNPSADRAITVAKEVPALLKAVKDLPADDPNTSKVVFITTYGTFFRRTLNDTRSVKDATRSKLMSAQAKQVDDEGPDEDGNDEVDEAELNAYVSSVDGVFNCCILDEAHTIKATNTLTHQAIVKANFGHVVLVTATAAINKAVDLVGMLSIINKYMRPEYRPTAEQEDDDGDLEKVSLEEYKAAHDELSASEFPTVNSIDYRTYLKYLDPYNFKRAMASAVSAADRWSATGKILKLVLWLIELRRTKYMKFDKDGEEIIVGASIPPYRIQTIEVEQGPLEAKMYADIYREVIAKLRKAKPDAEPGTAPSLDTNAVRTLSQATLHHSLANFGVDRGYNADKIFDMASGAATDWGYKEFHRLCDLDPANPPYPTRESAAFQISFYSAKLQVIADIIREVCIDGNRNLLIFWNWPSTQWVCELFCYMLDVNFISLHASHTRNQRSEKYDQFNDRAQTKATCFITSVRTSGASANLQPNCFDVLFGEIPNKANDTLQCIGRIWRIGQTKAGHIYRVIIWGTYDVLNASRTDMKFYAQLAGTCDITVTDAQVLEAVASFEAVGDEQAEWSEEQIYDYTRENLYQDELTKVYLEAHGQRAAMHGFTNVLNPTEWVGRKRLVLSEAANKVDPRVAKVYDDLAYDLEKTLSIAPAKGESGVQGDSQDAFDAIRQGAARVRGAKNLKAAGVRKKRLRRRRAIDVEGLTRGIHRVSMDRERQDDDAVDSSSESDLSSHASSEFAGLSNINSSNALGTRRSRSPTPQSPKQLSRPKSTRGIAPKGPSVNPSLKLNIAPLLKKRKHSEKDGTVGPKQRVDDMSGEVPLSTKKQRADGRVPISSYNGSANLKPSRPRPSLWGGGPTDSNPAFKNPILPAASVSVPRNPRQKARGQTNPKSAPRRGPSRAKNYKSLEKVTSEDDADVDMLD